MHSLKTRDCDCKKYDASWDPYRPVLSQQCRLAAGTGLQPKVRCGVASHSRDTLTLRHQNPSCDLKSKLFLRRLIPRQRWTKDLSLNLLFISGLGPEQMFLFLEWIIVC